MIMHIGKSKLDIKHGKFLDTSYKVITPYVCAGSLHWRKIFSSKVLPWMDSSGTALGTNRLKEKKVVLGKISEGHALFKYPYFNAEAKKPSHHNFPKDGGKGQGSSGGEGYI